MTPVGQDISQLGKHNLKTENIESLAFDLSKRLKVNVEFGYQKSFQLSNKTIEYTSNDTIIKLGRIDYKRAGKTIFLKDEFYQIHQILEKIGNELFEISFTSENSISKSEIKDAIDNIYYNIFVPDEDTSFGSITNNVFNYEYLYFDRWLVFCNLFTDKQRWNDHLNRFRKYRKQIKVFFELIGGSEVVYLNDQGETQYLIEDYNNWETILNELKNNFKQTTLNISEFMKQDTFVPIELYPMAFYDDFKDLKHE